jgi:hypothetical protein
VCNKSQRKLDKEQSRCLLCLWMLRHVWKEGSFQQLLLGWLQDPGQLSFNSILLPLIYYVLAEYWSRNISLCLFWVIIVLYSGVAFVSLFF